MSSGLLLDTCESTHDLAREHGVKGAAHGFWVSTREQTRGRGRQGRVWQSRPGNLFLSVILRPRGMTNWTWIPLLGAVSVTELLPDARIRIKWPNDLWLEGRKLGGVLGEAVSAGSREPFIVLGIGLNCAHAPDGLDQPTAAIGDPELADQIREPLARKIASNVERLDAEGPVWLRDSYERLAAFPAGSEIEWHAAERREFGRVLGLGDSGELRVQLRDGSEKRLFAEEIRALRPAAGGSPA